MLAFTRFRESRDRVPCIIHLAHECHQLSPPRLRGIYDIAGGGALGLHMAENPQQYSTLHQHIFQHIPAQIL